MPTELNLTRKNKENYIKKFEDKNKNFGWPPKESVVPLVQDSLHNLLEEEIKDIIKPQLKKMNTTIDSNRIIGILPEVSLKNISALISFRALYENVSDDFFNEVEQISSELLGQKDTCGWFVE